MLLYLTITAVLLIGIELLYFRVADKFNIKDEPIERSSHVVTTIRGGGIIFYFAAVVFFFMNGLAYPWFMAGLTLVACASFIDDVKSVSPKVRLLCHLAGMLLMFVQLGVFNMPWWYVLVALVFCTGVINAYNFMDGINGMTGAYSLLLLVVLGYVNDYVVLFAAPQLIYTLLTAVLIFNFFNCRKRAKCFAGDVGALSIAFSVLFLLGSLVIQTGDYGYLIMLIVYGVDTGMTIVHKLMLGQHIAQPGRMHMYHLMANELKIPHVAVSLIYMAVQGVIVVGYFYIRDIGPYWGYWYMLACFVVLAIIYVLFMKKYFKLHQCKE